MDWVTLIVVAVIAAVLVFMAAQSMRILIHRSRLGREETVSSPKPRDDDPGSTTVNSGYLP